MNGSREERGERGTTTSHVVVIVKGEGEGGESVRLLIIRLRLSDFLKINWKQEVGLKVWLDTR